jgi:hypothetical protein
VQKTCGLRVAVPITINAGYQLRRIRADKPPAKERREQLHFLCGICHVGTFATDRENPAFRRAETNPPRVDVRSSTIPWRFFLVPLLRRVSRASPEFRLSIRLFS